MMIDLIVLAWAQDKYISKLEEINKIRDEHDICLAPLRVKANMFRNVICEVGDVSFDGEKNKGGDKLVRTMTPWEDDQSLKLNRKVLESIIAVSCLKGRAFLISNGDTFTLYIGNKIARRDLTKTDLKQFSRLACKLDIDMDVDVHQPLLIGSWEDSDLLQNEQIRLQQLRKVI
jgi:hypothetical protein